MTDRATEAKDGLELTITSTYDLEGVALDWAVARCLGLDPRINQESHGRIWEGCWISVPEYQRLPSYSKSWSLAGPILDLERIELTSVSDNNGKYWEAWAAGVSPYDLVENEHAAPTASGKTPQIAVMRAFVISKVGLTMLVPVCLLDQSNEIDSKPRKGNKP